MSLKKRANWVLSGLGLLTVAISFVFVFSTPVFAACSASVNCAGGGSVSCNCPGDGTCHSDSDAGTVICTCGGQTPSKSQCGGPILD